MSCSDRCLFDSFMKYIYILIYKIDVTFQVPLEAVVCSGGGTRAMCGTFGGLRALQKLQLVDAVSYITGISGTW